MEVLKFLENNWKTIVELVVLLTTIILWIIRKRPVQVVDTVKETICRLLPYCISQAEDQPKGKKLDFCISLLASTLAELGINLSPEYTKFALEQVEIILSTPQKKEVK